MAVIAMDICTQMKMHMCIVTNVEKQDLRLKMIAKGTALRYTLTTEIGNVSNPKKMPFII